MGLNGKSAYAFDIQMLLQKCEEKMTSRAFHDVAHELPTSRLRGVFYVGCPHVKPVIDPLT
ncbi:MAG: hypothetical protein RLY60_1445 [Pseudomonadota bacterium]|jgi:hypothetical protein